jgi:hypothetical protein
MRGICALFFRESVAEMSRIRHDIRFGGVPNPREATVMTRLEQISVILNSSAKNSRPHAEERRSAQEETSLLDRMRAATRYDAKILWKYEPKQDPNVILVM